MDKLISDLGAAASVVATDVFEVEKLAGPPSQKATVAQLQTLLFASSPVVFKTGVASSHTGDTNETTLYSQALPALGISSVVEVRLALFKSGVSGIAVVSIVLGGTHIYDVTMASGVFHVLTVDRTIWNRGATNSQVVAHADAVNISYGTTNAGFGTFAIATNPSATLAIAGTLANAADTITLEAVRVIVWP